MNTETLALKIMKTLGSGLLSCLFAGAASMAHAGSIEGSIVFDKKNPFVGLAYLADANDGGPEICGSLDQNEGQFSEMLVVGKDGCEVAFSNSDVMDHNIFANDLESGVSFDVGLIRPGENARVEVNWHEGHLVRLGCKIHPKMISYIANLPTQHYSVIEFERERLETPFVLRDVPDEATRLEIVLQPLERVVVNIARGESKEVDITYKGKVFGSILVRRD